MLGALALLAVLQQPVRQVDDGPTCARHDMVLARLSSQLGMDVVAEFLNRDGKLLELLANLKDGRWVLLVRQDDQACIVDTGLGVSFKKKAQ
jgi:hypothetical protein